MGLRHESPLVYSINMWVGLGVTYPTTIETLATTSHESDAETLSEHKVLAHRCTTFHPHTCGLCRGAAAVDVTLIGYVDVEFLSGQR
jgi:hypothetical protein